MKTMHRGSVNGASPGTTGINARLRLYLANAAAKTATVWQAQSFVSCRA
jgi:hypothetical protein